VTDLRERLMTELRHLNARLGIPMAPRETSGDQGDEAARSEDLERDAGARTRLLVRHREIEATLVRMSDGSFGRCVDCDKEIASARLRVLPTAERCVSCQEKSEAAAAARATSRDFDEEEDE
jgi:RNA polymerase-binding transcription factor DksA